MVGPGPTAFVRNLAHTGCSGLNLEGRLRVEGGSRWVARRMS